MKIALCSSFIPFAKGGYRNIIEWLEPVLLEAGHKVERIYLPEHDSPDLLFQQMAAFRWIDLSAADRIICFRPQAHLIPHQHKVLWFIHHIRAFYDFWGTQYGGFGDTPENRAIRSALIAADTAALHEAKSIFTNSRAVSKRLKTFNNVNSDVLYPPVFQSARFHCRGYNDEILSICRMEHHKRQHLLVEAMQHTRTPVRLRLCGLSSGQEYPAELKRRIVDSGLEERIALENRWISEAEKIEYLADCLAVAYAPFDEDSYGYPSVEASHAAKPILTTSDAGGVPELVLDGINGYVAAPSPKAIAEAMDKLFLDRQFTEVMGENARARLSELNISWSHVVQRLLA